MRALISVKSLLADLKTIARITPRRSPKPILETVRLSVRPNDSTLESNDLETAARCRLIGVRADEPGTVCVNPRLLADALSAMPDEDATLTVDADSGCLNVSGQSSSRSIPTLSPDDHPGFPTGDPSYPRGGLTIESARLATAIKAALPCTDPDSTRWSLGGVCLDFSDHIHHGHVSIVGTDGHRLAIAKVDASPSADWQSPESGQFVLLGPAAKFLASLGSKHERATFSWEVRPITGETCARFEIGQWEVLSRAMDGRFPNYRAVLPNSYETRYVVDHAAFRAIAEAAKKASDDENREVDLTFQHGQLIAEATGYSGQSAEITGHCDPTTVALDSAYLVDMLRSIGAAKRSAGEIAVELIDHKSVTIWRYAGPLLDLTYAIMPLNRDDARPTPKPVETADASEQVRHELQSAKEEPKPAETPKDRGRSYDDLTLDSLILALWDEFPTDMLSGYEIERSMPADVRSIGYLDVAGQDHPVNRSLKRLVDSGQLIYDPTSRGGCRFRLGTVETTEPEPEPEPIDLATVEITIDGRLTDRIMARLDTESAVCYIVSMVPILALPAPQPIPPCQARKNRIGSVLRRLHAERKRLASPIGPIALHGPIGTDGASATDNRPNAAQSGRGFVLLGRPTRPVGPTRPDRPEPRITFDRPVPWSPVSIGPDPEPAPKPAPVAPAGAHTRVAVRVPVTGPRGQVSDYAVTVIDRRAGRYLIESPRGEAYEVSEFGGDVPTCECPAYRHQSEDVTTPTCKHIRALQAAGLLDPVSAPAPDVCPPTGASRLMSAETESLMPVCGGAPDDSTLPTVGDRVTYRDEPDVLTIVRLIPDNAFPSGFKAITVDEQGKQGTCSDLGRYRLMSAPDEESTMQVESDVCPADNGWEPSYDRWRHGGWYVTNVHYPSGAVGCVSRNYPDRKWRVVCQEHLGTFPNRDAAARAEKAFAESLTVNA